VLPVTCLIVCTFLLLFCGRFCVSSCSVLFMFEVGLGLQGKLSSLERRQVISTSARKSFFLLLLNNRWLLPLLARHCTQ